MTDLSNFSLADLRNLQEQIKHEMKNREVQELQKAREQILAIAQSVGVPLAELMATGRKGVKKKGSNGPVAVRFQHPENASQQWTGRGRQPRWVKEWVEAGKSLDALRVS
jgi:DNA-binding protein H-NS